ncbi:MAG: hypothetical protein JW940_22960 [Polyangiaceae bacterium]|nr:hypothetical protein [Polyangiaceae bacterium]
MADPGRMTLLGPRELMVVPAAPGSLVRVEGGDVDVGLGAGTEALPDAITWLAAGKGPVDIVVPAWTMARFVVVRTSRAARTEARVLVAMPRDDAMAFYRADEQVALWLLGGASVPRFSLATASHNAHVRWLEAARDALGKLGRTPAGRAWLQARWVELSLDGRPMRFPFVADARVAVRGGHIMDATQTATKDPEGNAEHRLVRAGEKLVFESADADSLSLLVRTRATGNTDVRVAAGAAPFARYTLMVPRRAEDAERWTPARLARIPIDERQPVRVEVERGEVWVSVRGYRLRTSTLDARGIRARAELLRQARTWLDQQSKRDASARLLWLRALVELDWSKSSRATRELSRLAASESLDEAAAALTWHELIVHGDGRGESPRELLLGLWRATERLSETARLVFRRSALERLADARIGPVDPPLGSALADPKAPLAAAPFEPLQDNGTDEERVRLALARETIDPPRDGSPSTASVLGEQTVRSWPDRRDLISRARGSWFEGTSWVVQSPELDTRAVMRVHPVFDAGPGEICSLVGPDGPRWLRVSGVVRRVRVAPGQGSHVRVLVRGIEAAPNADSILELDGTPVVVHAASGLGSTVAVAPGPRNWAVSQGPPVMALVPTEDQLPCSELLETERWTPVDGWTRFSVPASDVGTVVSVTFDPGPLGPDDRRVLVRVGDQSIESLVRRPASGVVEAFVPAGVSTVSLYSESRILARVRVRLHPSGGAPRRVRSAAPPSPARESDLLDSIVRLTRALRRSTRPTERGALWLERAKLLDELGYTRWARADRTRAGSVGQAAATPTRASQKDFELSEESGAVVPIGHLPKIPPLPVGPRQRAFERALARKAGGALPSEVLGALGSSADRSAGADALLLAVTALEVGDLGRAAAALERIGSSRPSAEALSWAAELYTDLASDGSSPKSASLKAYIVARAATDQGVMPGAALARLQPALGWHDVGPESVAGVAWVRQLFLDADSPSPGHRVRRALLDAKPTARLLGTDPVVVGLTSAAGVPTSLELVCHALSGPHEGCRYRLEVDGHPAPCEPEATRLVDDEVARPRHCRFTPLRAARRLTITPPLALESFGYVSAERQVQSSALPLVTEGQWWDLEGPSPMRLTVKGPTVLRITARALANVKTTLVVRAVPTSQRDGPVDVALELDPTVDTTAFRRADSRALALATIGYVVLPAAGPQSVTLDASGRALVRVAAVFSAGRARPKTEQPPAPTAQAPRRKLRPPPWRRPDGSRVQYPPEPGPVLLGSYARATLGEVLDSDRDLSRDYLELGLRAQRGALAERLRLDAALFQRLRQGPESTGVTVDLAGDLSPISPASFPVSTRSLLRLVTQDTYRGSATGILYNFALMGRASLSSDWTLSPMVALTERAVRHGLSAKADIDPDVTSVYARARPRSLDLALYLSHRPTTDGLFRYGLKARLLPDFDGIDAADASAGWRVLPGSGLVPCFELDAAMSLRPASSLRDSGFVRAMLGPRVMFWHWLAPSQRVTLSLAGAYYRDLPAVFSEADGFFAIVELGYDFSWWRGLGDLSAGDRPFQQRLEEGSGQHAWVAPARDPYWGGTP